MNINKSVVLNSIEPHPLSFRAPMGIDTRLNVSFFDQNGTPYSSDLGAQLQLTARSSASMATYAMPATDIANGRARATIPGGDIADPNGYRLRMVGTLNGEAALLAVGTVMSIAAAGLVVSEDVIDTINLTFAYNEPVQLDILLWQDTSKGIPYDLTQEDTLVTASVTDSKGGALLVAFDVLVLDVNKIQLSLTEDQVNALPASCWWSLVASTSAGATTLAEGTVTITGTVIPPLTVTTLTYSYQKPNNADPANGQVVHSTYTQNLLEVSRLDNSGVDQSATLMLVETGDTITLGATTWTVMLASALPGWFEFTVTPIAQDAVSGVTMVTFARP
jgi:hypothetical protein